MSGPVSGAELLKRIRPVLPEDATQICLRPDLLEQWEQANEALQELVAQGMRGVRVGTKPKGRTELAEKVQELEKQIEAHSATFRFRAMPKDQWRDLCDNHPPRKNNELDIYSGYNRDAVLDAAVRDCLIDPVFDDESWPQLVALISSGEWDELRRVVNSVNRGVVELPKSELASQILTPPASDSE